MKKTSLINRVIRSALIGPAIWLFSQTSAVACVGDFYVVWVEGENVTDIYVREVLVDVTGVNDFYGQISIPDEGVGLNNPSYMHTIAANAAMHNTKLEIKTTGANCVIDTQGKFLGVAEDVGIADLNP